MTNINWKAFIRYLVVAVCSAIVTFLSSSCTAGLVIGKNQRQQQENNISTKADSSHFVPTITIRYKGIVKELSFLQELRELRSYLFFRS